MEAFIAAVDEQASTARQFHDMLGFLRTMANPIPEVVEALRVAFRQRLHFPQNGDPSHFDHLEEVDAPSRELWRRVLDVTQSALIQARLADLLWTFRDRPRPDQSARRACRAYFALADVWDGYAGMTCVRRALDLARSVGDDAITREAYRRAEARFVEIIAATNVPGASLGYLRILTNAPAQFQTDAVATHVDAALRVFDPDPYLAVIVLGIQREMMADDASRIAIDEAIARRWQRAARERGGLAGMVHLQSAIEAASSLPALRRELLKEMRRIDPATLDLRPIETRVELDPLVLFRERERWLRADSITGVFDIILDGPAPSGEAERNDQQARRLLADAGLVNATHQLVLNPEAAQPRPVNTEALRFEQQRGVVENIHVSNWADAIAVHVLRILGVRYVPDRSELQTWIEAGDVPGDAATMIYEAMTGWWEGAPIAGCCLMLVASIEAIARKRLEERGGVVNDPANEKDRGGVRPLGDILGELRDEMDESWRRFLHGTLVSDFGFNLRNRLCHGLLLRPNDDDFVVLLIGALYLAKMGPPKPSEVI
jgi:hypothetical protein